MKKIFTLLLLALFTFQLSAQTMAFSVVEIKAKPFTQKDIKEAFEKVFWFSSLCCVLFSFILPTKKSFPFFLFCV